MDTIFKLIISRGHKSYTANEISIRKKFKGAQFCKTCNCVIGVTVLILCTPSVVVYNFTNFNENIFDNFKGKFSKEHNSAKTESGVIVLFVCTLSDDVLYLY